MASTQLRWWGIVMRLDPPSRRRQDENIVPMINVVFLLLIFFLMTAQMTPPSPVQITPPSGQGTAHTQDAPRVYIDQSGEVYFTTAQGADAIAAVVSSQFEILDIAADQAVDANVLIARLQQLNPTGQTRIELIIAPPRGLAE